jgi:transposase
MEARTVSSLPTAAPHHDAVRCLLAIELSKASWVVAVHTPLSDKISRYRLEGCDWKGLLELIERIRKRVAQELGSSVEMISCYEAGYDGFWLHRLLESHGVRNHVIDPASLQVIPVPPVNALSVHDGACVHRAWVGSSSATYRRHPS